MLRWVKSPNGERYMPAYHEMKLSDAYMDQDGECSLQLTIKVYNINKDAGSELLEKCPTLKQYSLFVEKVREYSKNKQTLAERDMVEIMNNCIKGGILPDFLSKHGREAVGMMFRELTQEEAMEMSRQDGYALGGEKGIERGEKIGEVRGRSEGEASGRAAEKIEMAKALKDKGVAIDIIAETSGLSKEEIEKL